MSNLSQETLSQAMHWLLNDENGMSSECLLATVINDGPLKSKSMYATFHPHDPSDFRRCVGLLNAAPEFRNRLHVMKSVSKHWSALVDQWDAIEQQMLEEIANPERHGYAPKTYTLMKEVLNNAAETQEQTQ